MEFAAIHQLLKDLLIIVILHGSSAQPNLLFRTRFFNNLLALQVNAQVSMKKPGQLSQTTLANADDAEFR